MARLPTLSRRRLSSPWRHLEDIDTEIERMMRGMMPRAAVSEDLAWAPSVDLADADGEFVLTAELPGVSPEDVTIDMEEGVLTLKGEKKEERERETRNLRLFEREYGSFERSFSLPRSVDPEQVKAEFRNGVLTVHLPKSKEATGRKIEIQAET